MDMGCDDGKGRRRKCDVTSGVGRGRYAQVGFARLQGVDGEAVLQSRRLGLGASAAVTCAVFGDLGPWRWGKMGIWGAKGPGTDQPPQSRVMYAGSGHVVSYAPRPWIKCR